MSELPQMDAYLAVLPDGLDSHPQAQQKASVYREVVDPMDLSGLVPHLPGPVAELLSHPQPPSLWVPDVHVKALYLAIRDHAYDSDDAYLRARHEASRNLFRSTLYRILMAVASPQRIVSGAGTRWSALHRGSTVESAMVGDTSARFVLRYPAHLIQPLSAKVYGVAFQAALEGAGGKQVSVELETWAPEEAVLGARWS